jgi:hypothetical protein
MIVSLEELCDQGALHLRRAALEAINVTIFSSGS